MNTHGAPASIATATNVTSLDTAAASLPVRQQSRVAAQVDATNGRTGADAARWQRRGRWRPARRHVLLVSFLVLLVCQTLMTLDVIADVFYIDLFIPFFDHMVIETVAVAAMGVGLVIVGHIVWEQFHENQRYRTVVDTASGRLLQTMQAKFDDWKLTPSEREVALLLIKGLSVNEIAAIRKAKPGTVKSQSNAIYRKAGVKNRSELAAWFMEDLLGGESLLESTLQERVDSRIDSAA